MDTSMIEEICRDRVDRWIKRMVQDHATPIVLVAVGHDHHKGEMHVMTTEELDDETVAMFMEVATLRIKDRL